MSEAREARVWRAVERPARRWLDRLSIAKFLVSGEKA